jgi:hypothetical protein
MAGSRDIYVAKGKGASASVEFHLDWLDGRLADGTEGALEVAKITVEQWADEVTEWMKENRPWQDRTTDARKSLGVLLDFGNDMWEAVLTGGVPYMVFLETARNHKYAILEPALDLWADRLYERLGAVRQS